MDDRDGFCTLHIESRWALSVVVLGAGKEGEGREILECAREAKRRRMGMVQILGLLLATSKTGAMTTETRVTDPKEILV